MKFIFFPLLIVIFFISCGDSSETELPSQSVQLDTLQFGNSLTSFPKLSNNASEVVVNWLPFGDLISEADQLHQISLEPLRERTNRLVSHSDSLVSKIPDTLNIPSIQSRLIIVKTRAHLLQQELEKSNLQPELIESNMLEAHTAITNLIVQINEKLQKDNIDMNRIDTEKKELEKQKRFLDSVYQAELRDQNNP